MVVAAGRVQKVRIGHLVVAARESTLHDRTIYRHVAGVPDQIGVAIAPDDEAEPVEAGAGVNPQLSRGPRVSGESHVVGRGPRSVGEDAQRVAAPGRVVGDHGAVQVDVRATTRVDRPAQAARAVAVDVNAFQIQVGGTADVSPAAK